VLSAVGDSGVTRAVSRRMRGGAALGGGALGGGHRKGAYHGGLDMRDVVSAARGVSKRYVRPALDIVEEFVPEARSHARRARRVLDAVGGAYLGGGRKGGTRHSALNSRRRRVMQEAQRLIKSGYPKSQALRAAWASA
jgi:hypothetical protein